MQVVYLRLHGTIWRDAPPHALSPLTRNCNLSMTNGRFADAFELANEMIIYKKIHANERIGHSVKVMTICL